MSANAYIIAASRTSVVPRGGAFRDLDFDALAVAPLHRCLTDSGLAPSDVDELILSNALGAGGNPARIAALKAGLPRHIAGLTIDRQCVGGLDAVLLAGRLIQSGSADIVLAGGSESYSLRPSRAYKTGWNGDLTVRDQTRFTPWPDRDPHMAHAAGALADKLGITADQQNKWAMDSHKAAMQASGRMASEIANPADTDIRGDPFTRNLTPALCAKAPKINGTISTATACVAGDGSAFVAVISDPVMERLKPAFALRIVDGVTCGGDPELPGLAPVDAITATTDRTGHSVTEMAVIELMEAYAVQAIACVNGANLPKSIINVGGGALARGHPVGASGTILVVRLFHELRQRKGLGLAAIAAAGGLGTAMIVESVDF